MLFAGWTVRIVENCDPVRIRSFSLYGPTPSYQLFIFPSKIGLQLGLPNFVIELVYVPSTKNRKKSNERTSESLRH